MPSYYQNTLSVVIQHANENKEMAEVLSEQAPQADEDMFDANIFMICRQLNPRALSALSPYYHIRTCRPDELALWKAMPFDTPEEAQLYDGYMTEYFSRVYAPSGRLFYDKCLFVCDQQDRPIATAFAWKVCDTFTTIQWVKVVKAHEGNGIGRALLSHVMSALAPNEYPVYLHTQPGSYRAIKLYADFGFEILVDPVIGTRKNDIKECLPTLEKYMHESAFKSLTFTNAPDDFIQALTQEEASEF